MGGSVYFRFTYSVYGWLGLLFSSIATNTPALLQKLQLDKDTWMETVQGFSKGFYSFVGPEAQLQSLCQKQKRHWVQGINTCRKVFKSKYPSPVTA